jgi:hypothetical protein
LLLFFALKKARVPLAILLASLATTTIITSLPSPSYAATPSSMLPEIFPSNIYRVTEHVHSVDESSVSNHHYSKFVKGYDVIFFAYQNDDLIGSDIKDPSFELDMPLESGNPAEGWLLVTDGFSFEDGYPIVERSPERESDGTSSLHLGSRSSGENFNYAGVRQNTLHGTPLSANFRITYDIFPVELSDETESVDSQIQVKFTLLFWDSRKVAPSIVFVYPDDPSEPLGLKNDTNSLYLVREAEFDEWNTVTEDLTEIAESYWGEEFMRDQAVDEVQLQVHTRNGAVAEAYFDSLQKDLEMSHQDVFIGFRPNSWRGGQRLSCRWCLVKS